jgi:hypothetical protein
MENIKVGDLVKVIKQPKSMLVDILGEHAYIEEIQIYDLATYALINTLRPNGDIGGCGSVPIDCLEISADPEYSNAQDIRMKYLMQLHKEAIERTNKYNDLLDSLSKKYSISKNDIEDIHKELSSF